MINGATATTRGTPPFGWEPSKARCIAKTAKTSRLLRSLRRTSQVEAEPTATAHYNVAAQHGRTAHINARRYNVAIFTMSVWPVTP